MRAHHAVRLLIVPGLQDSGQAPGQTWLQGLQRDSVRTVQPDGHQPDLARWSGSIARTLDRAGAGPWIAIGHGFGSLALVRHLSDLPSSPIRAALLVAPADPVWFGLADHMATLQVPVPSAVVASDATGWMPADEARRWAQRWGSHSIHLGDAQHVCAETGCGPLPMVRRWLLSMQQRLARERRATASTQEWQFSN